MLEIVKEEKPEIERITVEDFAVAYDDDKVLVAALGDGNEYYVLTAYYNRKGTQLLQWVNCSNLCDVSKNDLENVERAINHIFERHAGAKIFAVDSLEDIGEIKTLF